MTKPVLLLGSGRVGLAIARCLHRRGIEVTVASLGAADPPLRSRAIRGNIRLPGYRESPAAFVSELVSRIRQDGYDTLFPCGDNGLAAAAEHYETIRPLAYPGCPPPDRVRRVLDKELTFEAARREGIKVPATLIATDLAQFDLLKEQLRFPLIVKPTRKGRGTEFKIRYFQEFDELRRAFAGNLAVFAGALLQEYCPGEGMGVEVLMHAAEPAALFQHRRLKELPRRGGVSVLAVSEALDPGLADQAVRLLRALEWEGVAMVEFRFERSSKTAWLMEVNGRYWGSLPLSIQAGVEFPYYEWQLVHGITPEPPETYKVGVRSRWTAGELWRLQELLTEPRGKGLPWTRRAAELLRSLGEILPPTKDMMFSVRDPMPGIVETSFALRRILSTSARGFLKAMIPGSFARELRISRQIGSGAGRTYLRRRLMRAAGLLHDGAGRLPAQVDSVLFVCHGNIIRSPMAEALLRKQLDTIDAGSVAITSAGLRSKPAERADERARTLAPEFGVSLESHRPRSLTREMVEHADLIFVMDFRNEAILLTRHPEARSKLLLLGALASRDRGRSVEILDPYEGGLDDVRRCYESLAGPLEALADRMRAHEGTVVA